MRFRSTYLAIAMLAGVGLALNACGGGGDAPPEMEMPDLGPAQSAANTAATAAKTASDAAAAAVAGVEDSRNADAASFVAARDAAAAANAAYMAAKAAAAAIAGETTLAGAQAHQATAVAEQAKAEAALADAEKYAGMVQTAQDEIDEAARLAAEAEAERLRLEAEAEAAALAAARTAAADAAGAAQAASDAAKAAVDALSEDQQGADTVSYTLALASAQTAADAAAAANAASAAAAAADNSEDAEAQQLIAEAQQAAAEAANTEAMRLAGVVAMAYDQQVADALEQRQIEQRNAANAAIDAANSAQAGLTVESTDEEVRGARDLVQAAKDAVAAAVDLSMEEQDGLNDRVAMIETMLASTETAIADHRQLVADNAQRQGVTDAVVAAEAAVTALTATSTDEEVAAAKGLISAAETALSGATSLYTVGQALILQGRITTVLASLDSKETEIAEHRQSEADEEQRLAEEQQRMAVDDAIVAAMEAVDGLSATSTDDEVNAAKGLIQDAKDALSGATSILTAEQALAFDARISTIETTLSTTETAIAAHRQEEADKAETQRMADVSAARMAAMQSYVDADADATKAEEAADAAEETAPNSAGAMAAREAANAAREAAALAKAAHDAITDDMTKEEADAQAQTAADEAVKANSEYQTAKLQNDAIQTAHAINEEQNRMRDVADATEAAEDAAKAARAAATAARTAATDARTEADAANAAYMRALAARTDSDEAKKQSDAADKAASEAETAATTAEMAADAAEAAHTGIDPDGSGEDAQTAQTTAETQQTTAETQRDTAMSRHDNDEEENLGAKQLAALAEDAADTHVLRLFLAANGAHVVDNPATTNVDETAAHVKSVGAAMAAIANATAGAQAAGTTASAAWPGVLDDPDTDDNEAADSVLTISVGPGGATALPFELGADRAADNTVTPAITARTQTAKEIGGLGVFRGFEIWEDDGDATTATDRGRVIAFMNKTQDKSPVEAADAVTARSVLDAAITTPGELSNVRSSGRTITGVTWQPSGEGAMTGTLSCPAATACSITLGDDGAVTAISGYTFTGSRAAKAAVTVCDAGCQATANNNYLVFGLWLDEDTGTTPNTNTFGSFATGPTGYAVNVANAVTGTANYSGKAAGAHHKTGEGVNWFDGDARLTANFGAIDEAAERATDPPEDQTPGTISGEISNIRVNGGPALSDSIVLRAAALTDGTATFNGNARMGAGEIQPDDTVKYPYNGTWSGSFFGATDDDTDTADVNESVTAPLAAAGTFGVTRTLDMDTTDTADDIVESFVGAFGAHKQ